MSDFIQNNKFITIFGELIQSYFVNKIDKSRFYTVITDETTDVIKIEQFSLYIRNIDESVMKIRKNFVQINYVSDLSLVTTLLDTLMLIYH